MTIQIKTYAEQSVEDRNTGTTTKMILRAIADMMDGRNVVCVHDYDYHYVHDIEIAMNILSSFASNFTYNKADRRITTSKRDGGIWFIRKSQFDNFSNLTCRGLKPFILRLDSGVKVDYHLVEMARMEIKD